MLLFAAVLFGLTVRDNSPAAGLAALVATGFVAGAWLATRRPDRPLTSPRHGRRFLGAVLIFAVLGLVGWAPSTIGPTTQLLERAPSLVWAALAVAVALNRRPTIPKPVAWGVAGVTIVATLVIGLFHLSQVAGLGLDVYLLHDAAADAIASGQNPYTDAVEVPDGSPTAPPGATIVGYPYPPVTALVYAAGEWSLSDPRFSSLLSWIVVLGIVGATAARSRNRESLYVLLLLAAIPGWPLVLRGAWTEPLSLALLAIGLLVWRRSTQSGVSLGLGLASKQYFAMAAPLLLLHRDRRRPTRAVYAVGAIVVAIGVALLTDVAAFWSAAVEFHLGTPPRADSSNLIGALEVFGVDWSPPGILGPLAGLSTAAIVARSSHGARGFATGLALTLAVTFLFSTQAFANYWFLITGLCCLALLPGRNRESAGFGDLS